MGILQRSNALIARAWIADFDKLENKTVRIRYGLVAGWFGICFTFALFALKMILGLRSGSVSLIANAFHLLSHMANSVILVVSFKVTSRPATAKNPFGHGRMEHIAPLIMSVFLFVTGIQTGETSLHAEISEKLSPAEMHEIAERAEGKLRKTFGGEAVCHTDPMMERTPEIQALEDEFKEMLTLFPQIRSYHDFRVVAESATRKIIIADVDVDEGVREDQFDPLSRDLEKQVMKTTPNVAYCSFYFTPRFAY